MKYFGTDGIRGEGDYVKKMAYPLGVVLGKRGKVIVGRDPRLSSFEIEKELVKGLLSNGAKVVVVGIVPTPALHYLAKTKGAQVAVMITASHNPPQYNGLKVMATDGKLNRAEEEQLDELVHQEINRPSTPSSSGEVEIYSGGVREYKRHVISQFRHLNLSALDRRVHLDTAHGCFSYIAKDVFETLGADVVGVNNNHDGSCINHQCGALFVDDFASSLSKNSIGFAFDGDGDRVMAVIDGRVYDGDQMLFNLAKHYKKLGKGQNKVVGTIMTGGGVEKALSKEGITLVRTDVGDKYISQAMREENLLLGGEKSGLLIIGDKGETGDGLVTALSFLECFMAEKVKKVREYKTENYRLEVQNPQEYYMCADFAEKVAKARAEIGEKGRLIVRPSGTENCIRITIEIYDNNLEYQKIIKNNLLSKTNKK
jgi:phosphoglucosamine mutase